MMTGIDVMHAMAKAYNAQDIDAMMALISDDCIIQKDRGEVLVAGKASIREFYLGGMKSHPNMKLELKENFSAGTALFVIFIVKETKGLTEYQVANLYSRDPDVKIERASLLQLDNTR